MCHPHEKMMSPGAFCCGHIRRRFMSAKEHEEHLTRYRDELKKEIAGVEERIQELKDK